jgi:hypothetical protein
MKWSSESFFFKTFTGSYPGLFAIAMMSQKDPKSHMTVPLRSETLESEDVIKIVILQSNKFLRPIHSKITLLITVFNRV